MKKNKKIKKLCAYLILLSFIVIYCMNNTYGMETPVTYTQTYNNNELIKIPSLQKLCLTYIGHHAQQINLIDNLLILPAQLAEKALLCTNDAYINTHKTALITLAQSNTIDSHIACAIAQKCNDISLAYTRAHMGKITDAVANILVKDFLSADITTSLNDFDTAYQKAFPQEILTQDNYSPLYRALLTHITTAPFYHADWTVNDRNAFPTHNFEQPLTTQEIATYVAKKNFTSKNFDRACINGIVTLSPCKNFLAFSEDTAKPNIFFWIEIHQLKPRNKIILASYLSHGGPNKRDKIAFNQNASHIGILDTNGNTHSIEIGATMNSMLFKDISLQKIATLVYCRKQIEKMPYHELVESILFQNTMGHKEKSFVNFVRKHILTDIESFPICICKLLENRVLDIEHAHNLIMLLDLASPLLDMSKKEILTECLVTRNQPLRLKLYAIMSENFNQTMLMRLHAAFYHFTNSIICRLNK